MSQHKIIHAHIDHLRPILHWIRDELLSIGFDEPSIRKVELASEEALVNVIHHAYKGKEGNIEIEILSFPKSHVKIIISDEGIPFNPLDVEISMNPLESLEERKEGGLGLLFMKQYMDEIYYDHKKNKNILTLIKRVRTIH